MTMAAKQQLFRSALKRYLGADKQQKTKIIDELAANTRLHRKTVIRALKREQLRDPLRQAKRRRPKTKYGPAVTCALKELWLI